MKDRFKNVATVVGRVYDLGEGFRALQVKTVKNETSDNFGKEFIQGTINIAIDEEGLDIIPVTYTYVAPTFAKGKVNTSFGVLKSIIENDLTWVSKGKENAAMVRLTPALSCNDFISRDGTFVEAKQLEGGFAELTTIGKYPLGATFDAEMILTNAVEVVPEEDDAKPFVKVKGGVINYHGEYLPLDDLRVYVDGGREFALSRISLQTPVFSKVKGAITNKTIKTVWEKESDWGIPIVHEREKKTREWTIVNMDKTLDIDEDTPVTLKDLEVLSQKREIHKATVKREHEERQSIPAPAATNATPADAATSIPTGGFSFNL